MAKYTWWKRILGLLSKLGAWLLHARDSDCCDWFVSILRLNRRENSKWVEK